MSERIPLGEKEGFQREFKSADALRRPDTIGREIVGMLNAGGGEIWIGMTEENGVAVGIEDVPEADRAARVLLDHLVETIEPSLQQNHVRVEPVPAGSGRTILHVRVGRAREDGPPYAYRTRGGRYFGIRVADRLRTMAWSEIFTNGRERGTASERWLAATDDVTKQLDKALEQPEPRYWLYLKPVATMELEFAKDVEDLFRYPEKTNNRSNGWSFVDPHLHVARSRQQIVHGAPDGRRTVVRRNGSILFTAPLAFLHWKGEPDLIWPYTLIEFAVSIFRLASNLYARQSDVDDDRIATRLALISARGWKLKGGSVRSVRWSFGDARAVENDDAISELSELRLHRLLEAPDGCAYPLIHDIYEEFGLGPDDIPSELDPDTGLTFPT
ncbi:MAG: ATP-binding protein [Thermodesulfobacteriota bacterium]